MAVFIIFVLIAVLIYGEMQYNRELRNRVGELEEALMHLYECHLFGGEIAEDEHKKAMADALRLLHKDIDQPERR